MKKFTNHMRVALATFLLTGSLFGQEKGVIWTVIPNGAELIHTAENVESNSAEINALIQEFGITAIFPAVPASKNPLLRSLYEVQCDCNENDLLYAISKYPNLFENPEIGPHYETLFTPNDLTVTFTQDYALDLINAYAAWDITYGDADIEIAISDAGYYFEHPEFQNKTTYQSTGIGTSNIAHGTAVAICAAGETNNDIGKSSIGFNSSLQLYGMNYNELLAASNNGADVINASWASGCYYSSYGQMIVDEIYNNGTILVCAAGNGGTCSTNHADLVYPAAFDHVISVTSIGPNDNHERIPGDPMSTHQHNAMVDICAPGYDIALSGSPTWYTYGSGTSFAAPIVSGTVALMLAVNPCLNPDQVVDILKNSADTNVLTLNPQYQGALGAGRLDAAAAVLMAQNFNSLTAVIQQQLDCSTGSYEVSVTNCSGQGALIYDWSHDYTNNSATTLANAGTHYLTITDSLGCVFSSAYDVEEYTPISIATVVEHPSCYGMEDGTITAFISGGSGVMNTTWSTGSSDLFLNDLEEGIYEITAIDEKLCVRTATVEILQPLKLEAELLVDENNESIEILVEGGTAPYLYFWNEQLGQEVNVLINYYSIQVVDSRGCTIEKQYSESNQQTASVAMFEESFELYPNPFNEFLTLKNDKMRFQGARVYDLNGKIVYEITMDAVFEATLNMSELDNGYYILELQQANNDIVTTKIIKGSF